MHKFLMAGGVLLGLIACAFAQELKPIPLPQPSTEGGKPLMQALKERHTTREFSAEKIPLQVLSNLLWAANGINRDDGHRTAPSAMNKQETDIYIAKEDGVYLYDAKTNTLVPIVTGDHRAAAGKQDFVANAPLNLIYVADYGRMGTTAEDDKRFYAAADVGFIAENVYLYCASDGLNCVVRGYVDRDEIAKLLKLRSDQHVLLGQTVGYPWKH
jgi:SagB-type dehydrogenase family enzyme